MLAEISPAQAPTCQHPLPSKERRSVATHLLAFVFALTALVIQLFVPYFAELLDKLGEKPLPALTVAILHYQILYLGMAAAIPPAVFYFAWRRRFRVPLSKATIGLIVFATILNIGTAYALLSPMRGVLMAAENITPQAAPPYTDSRK